jgi:hypothetical protein
MKALFYSTIFEPAERQNQFVYVLQHDNREAAQIVGRLHRGSRIPRLSPGVRRRRTRSDQGVFRQSRRFLANEVGPVVPDPRSGLLLMRSG